MARKRLPRTTDEIFKNFIKLATNLSSPNNILSFGFIKKICELSKLEKYVSETNLVHDPNFYIIVYHKIKAFKNNTKSCNTREKMLNKFSFVISSLGSIENNSMPFSHNTMLYRT